MREIWLRKKCSSDLRKYGCENNIRQTCGKIIFVRLTYTVKEVCRNISGKISVNLA